MRDCKHGLLACLCEMCKLERDIAAVTAERNAACDISTCCLREIAALKGRVVDLDAQLSAALEAVKRRDEVIEELCVKLNRHTCPASEAWDVCRNKNVECKDCWRDWIKSKLEKVNENKNT